MFPIRRAGEGFSRAVPRRERTNFRARRRSSRRWRARRIAGRSPTPTWKICSASIRAGRNQGDFESGIRIALQAILAESGVCLPLRAHARGTSRRARTIASAIWNWRRGCRTSCGAARRTTQLITVASAGQAAGSGGARKAGAPHAGRSAVGVRWSRTSPASGCICRI